MLLTILPFFLASRIVIDDYENSQWKLYGAECVYDVLITTSLKNITSPKGLNNNNNSCRYIGAELKCRVKHEDSLSCHFENPWIGNSNCASLSKEISKIESNEFISVAEEFEIRFNENGIENMVVPRSIPRWKLDIIKSIASQFHLGFDRNQRLGYFHIMENSTVGYCETMVTVINEVSQTEMAIYDGDSKEDGDFMLVLDPPRFHVGSIRSGSLRIKKSRDPKRCPQGRVYLFGERGSSERGGKVHVNMTSSTSDMFITTTQFKTSTETIGMIETQRDSILMKFHQNISLTLKSTRSGTTPSFEVFKPASTSVYTYANHYEVS